MTAKYLIQWEGYGHVDVLVVEAATEIEAREICKRKSVEAYERDRLIIARAYDPITDGDVRQEKLRPAQGVRHG